MVNNLNADTAISMRFGDFVIDIAAERLTQNGTLVKLEPQLFACLALLVSRPGEVVSRQEIQAQVWSGRHVSDEAVRAAFKKLRVALGDDARDPRYIKTIPKQGYKLIGKVRAIGQVGAEQNGHSLRGLLAVALFVAVLLAILLLFFKLRHPAEPETQFTLNKLTNLAGSEVFANYHAESNKIVFLHRANSADPQQIYLKYLDNGRTQRLSWDDAHYSDIWLSHDGNKLAYIRATKDGMSNLIAEFKRDGSIKSIIELQQQQLQGKFVIGWASDSMALYLVQEAHEDQSMISRGIFRLDLSTNRLSKATSPSVTGAGDVFAAESLNGKMLAVLREVIKGQYELVIVDLATGSLVANRVLPLIPSRIVWHSGHHGLTISSFTGEAVQFDIKDDNFIELPTMPANSNDIFASCGTHCYFMRQHNGNYFDIQERPNPFSSQALSLVASDLFSLSGAEDFPIYSKDGSTVYFASLTHDALLIQRQTPNKQVETLARWPANLALSSLQVSDDEKYLAGVAAGRLFLLPLKAQSIAITTAVKQPNYLTNALEQVSNPVWQPDSQSLYLTVRGKEDRAQIDAIDVLTHARTMVAENYIGFHPIDTAQGHRIVVVDAQMDVWLLNQADNGSKQKLARLQSTEAHRWTVTDTGLYFTTRVGRGAFLNFVAFNALNQHGSQQPKRVSLGNNRFRLNFAVNASQSKLLLVESLNAQSDLVRVSW